MVLSTWMMSSRRQILSQMTRKVESSRSLFTIIDENANAAEELKEFVSRVQNSACDPFYGYRKERMKPKEWRFQSAKKKQGKISNHRVRAVVELINFQRAYKLF